MYEVTIRLEDILHYCDNWVDFCKDKGFDVYSVANGGGDIEVVLTKEELIKYNLL